MSMSTNVIGIVDMKLDEKFQLYRDVAMACDKAGLDFPPEVETYFETLGVEIDEIENNLTEIEVVTTPWDDGDMKSGYELNVSDIPKNVTKIRFYNSY